MDEISPQEKPKRSRWGSQEWITAFDRDLIRAARDQLEISYDTIEEEEVQEHVRVVQVDSGFIKVRRDDDEWWVNKGHICNLRIHPLPATTNG